MACQKYWKKSSERTQLLECLENNNLLNESQCAYRYTSSTEQALVNVAEQIYKSIDKSEFSLLVLLDRSKAFDSANHDFLLNKLVQINIGSTSNLYGVPQGLVQSSLTFLSMTFLKLVHYQKLPLAQPFMQTMFNSFSVAHLIISSS